MARLARLYLPGCAQHVIQRGNNREACFYDEADYKAYLTFLRDAATKYQVAIHAFVLMTNHVHLLATPDRSMGSDSIEINSVRAGMVGESGGYHWSSTLTPRSRSSPLK